MRASGWEHTRIIAQVAVTHRSHIRDKFTQVLLFLLTPPPHFPLPAPSPLSFFPPSVVTGKSQKPVSNKGPGVQHLTNRGVCNDAGECVNGVELIPEVRRGAGIAIPPG